MKKRLLKLTILSIGLCTPLLSHALDINLLNVNMGANDRNQLNNTYGSAYGFRPDEVDPVMEAPPEEVPTLLRIAQAAKTSPLTVWMLRKAGLNYGNILSNYSMAPQSLYNNEPRYGDRYRNSYSPGWGAFTDPFFVQSSRTYFYRDILGVPVSTISQIPWRGMDSVRVLLDPNPRGFALPPGIAKKHGLWVPPGQRKKMGAHNFYEESFRHPYSENRYPSQKGWKDSKNPYWYNDHDHKDHDRRSYDDEHGNAKRRGSAPYSKEKNTFFGEQNKKQNGGSKLAKGSEKSEKHGGSNHSGKGKHK